MFSLVTYARGSINRFLLAKQAQPIRQFIARITRHRPRHNPTIAVSLPSSSFLSSSLSSASPYVFIMIVMSRDRGVPAFVATSLLLLFLLLLLLLASVTSSSLRGPHAPPVLPTGVPPLIPQAASISMSLA